MTDRVEVGALFRPEDFAAYAGQKVLVLCDIEGAERELLDPAQAPALAGMDIIVESHECLIQGITQTLIDRFKPTHRITLVQDDGQRQLQNPRPWFLNLAYPDQLLAGGKIVLEIGPTRLELSDQGARLTAPRIDLNLRLH